MKHVTIIVPEGQTNLSSITGTFEILSRANQYWQKMGNSPRIEFAKSTLEKGRKNIFEVMYKVGYSDDKAFREVFKKITGLSPVDYRAKFNKETVLA